VSVITEVNIYTVQAHICVCHTIAYFRRNEVMDCLLRKFHDLPTACRTILIKEQREQVIHAYIRTVHVIVITQAGVHCLICTHDACAPEGEYM